MRARGKWEAFLLGWLSQTVAWLLMVPWVVRVMSHYGGLPYVTGVADLRRHVASTSACSARLFAARRLRAAAGASVSCRWLLVPLAWAAIEFARTYLLTGFPWNLIAAAIVDYTPLIQIDRAAGPYLLGCLSSCRRARDDRVASLTHRTAARAPMLRVIVGERRSSIVLLRLVGDGLRRAEADRRARHARRCTTRRAAAAEHLAGDALERREPPRRSSSG